LRLRVPLITVASACLLATLFAPASADEAYAPAGDAANVNVPDSPDAKSPGESGNIPEPSDADFSPTWTFRGGAVVVQRQSDRPRKLATALVNTSVILEASQFKYAMQGGPDLDLIHHGDVLDLEFRYFAVDQLIATIGPISFSPDVVAISARFKQLGFLGDATAFSASEYSQLRSFELNCRKEITPFLTLLAG